MRNALRVFLLVVIVAAIATGGLSLTKKAEPVVRNVEEAAAAHRGEWTQDQLVAATGGLGRHAEAKLTRDGGVILVKTGPRNPRPNSVRSECVEITVNGSKVTSEAYSQYSQVCRFRTN